MAVKRFLLILRSNWLSWWGAILTTLAFLGMITTFIFASLHGGGPYIGIIAFIALPTLFVMGITMIPIGLLIYRKQLKERIELLTHKPLHLLRLLALLTVINLAALGTGGYEALHYMESEEFCGQVCHEVMSPTLAAYKDSPHARVACVECHIGEGASWFVKSKLSGLRQVAAVLFDSYERPVPTPVHNLRPARETCEQCHWPDKFSGDRLVVRKRYGDDAEVTEYTNVLVMKTGGTRPNGTVTGIHWHVHPDNKVSYVATDKKREKIPWVKYVDAKGRERIYTTEDLDPNEPPPAGEFRTMDCVDCHNQPSHSFQLPDDALDDAIAHGLVSRELPFIRKVGLEALKMGWTRTTAEAGIRKHIEGFYQKQTLSDEAKKKLRPSIDVIAKIWMRNIYPEMRITWGTYPSFAGHKGCLRCHDGNHVDADGEEISMDCEVCHITLAQKERDPEVLEQLGLNNK